MATLPECVPADNRKARHLYDRSSRLSRALGEWMERDQVAKGGKFLLYDTELRQVLDLKIVKLDDGDHLHRLENDRFLSWGEFVDASANKYFLDIYFRRAGASFVFDSKITIYSRNGVRRYRWDETGPVMRKIPAP